MIREVERGKERVIVTIAGGLFVGTLSDEAIRNGACDRFHQRAARSINLLLCDLALAGRVSAPASPAQMGAGEMSGGTVKVKAVGGAREMYAVRPFGPQPESSGPGAGTYLVNPDILDAAVTRGLSLRLAEVTPTMPGLVVGAFSNISKNSLHLRRGLADQAFGTSVFEFDDLSVECASSASCSSSDDIAIWRATRSPS